jgi:hypothetical protein
MLLRTTMTHIYTKHFVAVQCSNSQVGETKWHLSPTQFLSYSALPIYFSGNRTEHDKTDKNYDRLRKIRHLFGMLDDSYARF